MLYNSEQHLTPEAAAQRPDAEIDMAKVCPKSIKGRADDLQTNLRIELQTLTRLPSTSSLVFSFKTYMYPVDDIKKEGLGPDLAEAIQGLKKGNAPAMWVYKGGVKWGEELCEYLRRKIVVQ